MKLLLLSVVLLFSNNSLVNIRQLYESAYRDEDKTEALIRLTESTGDVVKMGYNGAAKIIMANHVFNPVTKLRYFNNGKSILENAIAKAPANTELRYLRLTIQLNAPSFLGYNKMIEADKMFLQKNVTATEDADLKKMITDYLESLNR